MTKLMDESDGWSVPYEEDPKDEDSMTKEIYDIEEERSSSSSW